VIIVQTPLRVSFFGGGTDFPSFYQQEGGCVLTSAINKYIFVTIKERFDRKIRIGYTQTEMVDDVGEIQHELIREALIKTGIRQGVEITTMGDIPSAGSGLGSSSTVTVGSLHAMYSYLGEIVPVERLAREACEIEIDILGKPIGVQDQYIAAHGGLRLLEFCPDGEIISQRIDLDSCLKRQLNESLLLFYTGITRRSETILDEQKKNINGRLGILRELKHMTLVARDELLAGRMDAFGGLLHESWQLKKQLASQISNGSLDDIYHAARHAGAIGGKITGAGGGGFMLLYCPFEKREAVRDALGSLQEVPIQLESDGTKVIFNYRRN
jgi:D-glycero-alpha-D-manno-heptose-7-phosphate kinase